MIDGKAPIIGSNKTRNKVQKMRTVDTMNSTTGAMTDANKTTQKGKFPNSGNTTHTITESPSGRKLRRDGSVGLSPS